MPPVTISIHHLVSSFKRGFIHFGYGRSAVCPLYSAGSDAYANSVTLYSLKLVLESFHIQIFKEVSWHSFNLPGITMT